MNLEFKAHLMTAGEVRKNGDVFSEECLKTFAEENPVNFSYKDGKLIYRGVLPPVVFERLNECKERISVSSRMGL